MDTRNVTLRKLAHKSVLDFGKYEQMSVQHIIDIGEWSYLAWLYYNASKISFIDEVKKDIYITKEREIDKPGKDPVFWENNKDDFYKDHRSAIIGSHTEKGKSKSARAYRKSTKMSKRSQKKIYESRHKDTLRNQGHKV